jgi:hypothetical protein
MHLGAVAAVGLKGTLGHRTVLIRESLPCGQVLSIADSVQIGQSLAIPARHPSPRIPFGHLRSTRTRSASPGHAIPRTAIAVENLQLRLHHFFACFAFHASTRRKT